MAGVPIACDACEASIVGPRWQCVHCEGGVDLCVGCVAKTTSGRGLQLRDGRVHPKLHVFRRVRQSAVASSAAVVDLGSSSTSLVQGSVQDATGGGAVRGVDSGVVSLEEDADEDVPLLFRGRLPTPTWQPHRSPITPAGLSGRGAHGSSKRAAVQAPYGNSRKRPMLVDHAAPTEPVDLSIGEQKTHMLIELSSDDDDMPVDRQGGACDRSKWEIA